MNAPELVRNHTNEGIYCALVVRGGRKWLRVVILDSSMCARARCGLPRSQETGG